MNPSFLSLLSLASRLRSEKGCPWDRKQTIESMKNHLEEEALEVKEAINKEDYKNLKEELGDLLFQIIMIAQIASEQKIFNMDDVIKNIENKIISRHTWVFGSDTALNADHALDLWEKNKQKEKESN